MRTGGKKERMREEIRAEKQRQRQLARERRARISPEALAEGSRRIEEQVLALPAYQEAQTVMAYMSMPGEPETRGIILDAIRRGKRVLLPRCLDGKRMEAALFTGFEDLVPGRMGIPEPGKQEGAAFGQETAPERQGGTEKREPKAEQPDLILIPCMAATPDGKRLGHGAGYYDRFLPGSAGLKVCLCFQALLAEDLPTDENDIRMDLVVTDSG